MKPLRIAIFGAGFWSRVQLAAWREVGGAECVAIYNRTRARAEAFARDLGVPAVYDSPEKLLRDGEVVGGGEARELTHDRLVSLMVGRQLNQLFPERTRDRPTDAADGRPALEVRDLSQPGVVRHIAFSLAAGEVLGLSGLMGAGRSELARILFGLEARSPASFLGRRLTGRSCLRLRCIHQSSRRSTPRNPHSL